MESAEIVMYPDRETVVKVLKASACLLSMQIADCVANGVRNLIIVVGNDDNATEFNLVPLETAPESRSPREKGALEDAEKLRKDLATYWLYEGEKSLASISPPTISVMTLQRRPLKSFDYFPRLPPELQDMIWEFALRVPRVLTLTNRDDELSLLTNRQPALASVCQASRRVAQSQVYRQFPDQEDFITYYNPAIDTVRLDLFDEEFYGSELRAFSKYNIESLGIDWEYGLKAFFASDAKLFSGLREIVILIGRTRLSCEIEMVPISETAPERPDLDYEWQQTKRMRNYANGLREDMEKVSKKWKAYQRRRVRQGKSSPDWIVPSVRIAYMKPIYENVTPYSYESCSYRRKCL
jgi:hypothetical protein